MFEHRGAERQQINKQARGGIHCTSLCTRPSAPSQAWTGEIGGARAAPPPGITPPGWGWGRGSPEGQRREGREKADLLGKRGETNKDIKI